MYSVKSLVVLFLFPIVATATQSTLLWVQEGSSSQAEFGSKMVQTRDVDHDGVRDLAVTSPYFANFGTFTNGRVDILSSETGHVLWNEIPNSVFTEFSFSLTSGDWNGDGIDDLLISAPKESSYGRVHFRMGSIQNGAFSQTAVVDGFLSSEEYFGAKVQNVGDLNFDGIPEFSVSSAHTQPLVNNQGNHRGRLVLFNGSDRTPLAIYEGTADHDNFGSGAVGGKDITGDGIPDFVIGAGGRGQAHIVSGANYSITQTIVGGFGRFGDAMLIMDDINQNGLNELVVGKPGNSGGFTHLYEWSPSHQELRALNSIDGDFPPTASPSITDPKEGKHLGQADLTGDGIPELIVSGTGYLVVYWMNAQGQMIPIEHIDHTNGESSFGISFEVLGTSQLTGSTRVAVSAPAAAGERGRVYLYEIPTLSTAGTGSNGPAQVFFRYDPVTDVSGLGWSPVPGAEAYRIYDHPSCTSWIGEFYMGLVRADSTRVRIGNGWGGLNYAVAAIVNGVETNCTPGVEVF